MTGAYTVYLGNENDSQLSESFFFGIAVRCPSAIAIIGYSIFDIRQPIKNNYGKSVNAWSLFIGFCDPPVKITLTCMVNSLLNYNRFQLSEKLPIHSWQ